ncbi:hypothetical protein PFLUV_G00264190 [Xyrichtys novacula]|uniref:Uncharacterized protein n=1 Tax=Xyrichtys novacula TaxID=13765 RepID=A0AAV1F258_XYRNO|nr:hypothetical protein PFLUV_G00264190 [Xyrichtys novacula]
MCIETMDSSSNQIKTSLVRRNNKPQSKMRWEQLRVSASEEGKALKHRRVTVMKTSISNHPYRCQEQKELEKLVKSFRKINKKERRQAKAAAGAAVPLPSHPVGAMAPENTTQYLMGEVYKEPGL